MLRPLGADTPRPAPVGARLIVGSDEYTVEQPSYLVTQEYLEKVAGVRLEEK